MRIVARHDAPDNFAIAPGEKERGIAVLVKGMFRPIEKFLSLEDERRDPGGIVAVNLPREFDESVPVRAGNNARNFYARHCWAEAALLSEVGTSRRADRVRKT